MHIPDGLLLNGGAINGSAAAVSASAFGFALWRTRKTLGQRQAPLLAVTAAFIFAAQMLNFPIAGGTSGHFLGAAMAAILLGPWNSLLAMTVVLVIQCLMFGDGGLTTLGTNIFNMGIVAGLCAWAIFRTITFVLPKGRWSFLTATAIASWWSVVLAAGACALELALAGTIPLRVGLPAMMGTHAVIGAGEAVITTAAAAIVLAARPDLVASQATTLPKPQGAGT